MNVSVNLSKNARQIQNEAAQDEKLSWFHKLFELSVSNLLRKCRTGTITIDDLPPLEEHALLQNLMKGYKWKRRVIASLLLKFWKSFVVAFIFRAAAIFADYASILLLKYLIDAAEVTATLFTFFVISVLILFFTQLKSLLFGAHTYLVAEDSALMAAVLNNIIVKKALFLTSANIDYTSSRIIKLVTTHSEAISSSLLFVHHSWAAIIEIAIAMFWIWETLGTRVIIAVAVVAVVYLILNFIDSYFYKKSLKQQVKLRDERVEFGKTVLESMDTIKTFAWEDEFGRKLHNIRKQEILTFRKTSWINYFMHSLNITSPFVVMFVSFSVYGLSSEISALRFEDAFVLIAIFNYLRRPLHTIIPSLEYLNKAFHSATRINQFINARQSPNESANMNSKKGTKTPRENETENTYDVILESANFSWNGTTNDLKEITLEVKKGEFHAIVGFPLCGKSSLLCAIIGELKLTKGKRWVSPRISFAPAQPFVFSQSVKANILFGNNYEKTKYDQILSVCDLRKDIFGFPRCDATMIGEKGFILSDTQKAQISLARCLYEDADIYALDKAFGMMDRVTTKKVHERVFGPNGYLVGKTVIFATNNIRLGKICSKIHVLKDGRIEASGSYDEILKESAIMSDLLNISDVDDKLEEKFIENPKKKKTVMFDVDRISLKKKKPVVHILDQAVEIKKRNSYLYYFRSCSFLFFSLYFIFLVTRFVLQSLAFFWLSFWLDPEWRKEECQDCPQFIFLHIMSFFAIAAVCSNMLAYLFSVLTNVEASRKMYDHILMAMFAAPMSFFTNVNVEEFIQLFTAHLDIADTQFPLYARSLLETSLNILMIFAIVSVNLPIFLIFALGFLVFIFILLKFYFPTSHKVIHLENHHLNQFLCCVTQNFETRLMVRVFGKSRSAINEISENSDILTRCRFAKTSALRWLSLRVELMSNLIIFSCFIAASLCLNFHLMQNAHFALSVTVILCMTELVSTFLRVICTLESMAPSIQKICNSKNYPKEPVMDSCSIQDSWPENGCIDIENLNVFVKKEKHVLKDVCLSVEGQEKLGIVGKPGAGKSQLARTLIAMSSADEESRVFIDGVNVFEIGVNTLRSRVTVIPQKAKIFSDTLRNNIDPCDQFADSDVWLAIESCQMKEFVKGLSHGIDQQITADLMSEEQKEQINVCRALLKGGQIFVIDQSTQFMNEPTKSLLEQALRENLKQSTTITIGEDFHDVEHCDRVVVLENGVVVNVDTPQNLISKFGTLQNYLLDCPV